ncbi:MAG TPA: RNA polymerase sigma factor [Roseiflexaceae bacterium]|nr:RNA polymerase sigma factor [Roseiflexaceae bacterium]
MQRITHYTLLSLVVDEEVCDKQMMETGHFDNSGDDLLLLRQIAQGQFAALEQLFVRYQRQVYQLALGITRDAETAEEVLQDTFYRLHVHAGELDGSLPLLPWLYRVAANLAYNQARRRSFWGEPFHALAERLSAPALRSPEHIAEQHEMQAIVRSVLDDLPPNHRAVLVLHYLQDYSIPEIATIFDCPEGTVKSRLHHARKLLKAQLQRHYGGAAILPDQL